MKKYNTFFLFILESCALLEEFKLSGHYPRRFSDAIGLLLHKHLLTKDDSKGTLCLDFRQHAQLKYIEINMKGCKYYTFHHHPGKKWKNIDEEILEENSNQTIQNYRPYHINLA